MKISIIGAGIGGLTTALALQKNGFSPKIYEATPEIKPIGAGIAMASNAMQVFENLGVRKEIENAGHSISEIYITDNKLNTLSETKLGRLEQKYGVKNVAILRTDLQQILAQSVDFQNIILSKRLLKIEGNYELHFQDNTTENCDVLLGADGIHSVVRKQIFGEKIIRNTHQKCWRGLCNFTLAEKYQHRAFEMWGKGKRFGFVRVSKNKVYWYAVINSYLTHENSQILNLYKEFHKDALNLVEATEKESIILNDIIDLQPIKTWHKGNVCLLGDAAHATTPNMGQGACQAVEDAFILGLLFGKNDDVEQIFSKYEKIRRKKVENIVKTSWNIGKVAHFENDMVIWLRNNLLKIIPKSFNEKQLEKIFILN